MHRAPRAAIVCRTVSRSRKRPHGPTSWRARVVLLSTNSKHTVTFRPTRERLYGAFKTQKAFNAEPARMENVACRGEATPVKTNESHATFPRNAVRSLWETKLTVDGRSIIYRSMKSFRVELRDTSKLYIRTGWKEKFVRGYHRWILLRFDVK